MRERKGGRPRIYDTPADRVRAWRASNPKKARAISLRATHKARERKRREDLEKAKASALAQGGPDAARDDADLPAAQDDA